MNELITTLTVEDFKMMIFNCSCLSAIGVFMAELLSAIIDKIFIKFKLKSKILNIFSLIKNFFI